MKKFRIELEIQTSQTVIYEVEAENREDLDNLLSENCVEDIGTCVDESIPEQYSEETGRIWEV